METILQRLEQAEKASDSKYGELRGAFNELLAQAMGIKAENDQLRDQLKLEQDTFKRLKSDSIHNHTESEKVNEDLRKRLKTAEEICAKQKTTSVLKQTELENLNNNLRGKLKKAEETCKNQAAVQEILADLFQKPRSNVADSETLPTPTKRSMSRDDQPDSKSKLPKLSHTPRGSPTPTPISATTPSISDACNDKEGRLPPSAPRTILRNKHGDRIDQRIHPEPDPKIVCDIKNARPRLCNNFYLNGHCPYQTCEKDHLSRLNPEELETLRYVARLVQCKNGRFCINGRCTCGHSCPHNEKCVRERCRWPPELHGVEQEVYEKLRA